MRKECKRQIENFINLLPRVNEHIIQAINTDVQQALCLIADSYDGMERIYNIVAESEREESFAVTEIARYRQLLEAVFTLISENRLDDAQELCGKLSSIWNDMSMAISRIKETLEVVFMPYKAAMWDSLESVWMAANADPDCDAYVVPIPYYDRNPDHSLGTYHYEAELMPSEVPITHYNDYDLEERKPDVIYIHNPYDGANNVTSIEPRFYADKLKKHTDCLVYIPYYSTTGGMAESQEKCPAYYHADYIVIQAEKYRKFFDPALPDEKFLPLGSPKFDRVIRICKNPPEPPVEWEEKMQGKKVYFYNTSLAGMLGNTESFFRKMQYVFDCFKDREDACLLWRPHPLFESTIDSMRSEYRPVYEKIKNEFLENNLGIYDTTPDITNTIALCDAYIGDGGTSVTSLFGVAGKPMFILNNNIHHLPKEDDWRGEIIREYGVYADDDWKVTQGNKLYHAAGSDYKYHYVCDLCDYAGGGYFGNVITIGEKSYVCPVNAQEIVVVNADTETIAERIPLKREVEQSGAFYGSIRIEKSIYLIPRSYPAIVRYDTETKNIDYFKGYNDIFVKQVQGEVRCGGYCEWNHHLLIASPTDDKVLAINNETGNIQLLSTGAKHTCGCIAMLSDGMDVWMLPFTGKTITQWNPQTGTRKEYSDLPKGFACKHRPHGYICEDRPFGWGAFTKKYVYFPPNWGNMFVRLNRENGKLEEWKPPFAISDKTKSDYYNLWSIGYFSHKTGSPDEETYHYFSLPDAKLYDVNLETNEYKEIPVIYDKAELEAHVSGFMDVSDWLMYCCEETSFHTLTDFLNGDISGNGFEKEKQIRSYEGINASCDGDCGVKVHVGVKEMFL